MYNIIIVICLFLLPGYANAHEDHAHGPANVPLQKGGILRSLETVHLELVYKNKMVKIYPFNVQVDPKMPGHLSSMRTNQFPVSATVELPKRKAIPLSLKDEGDHWTAQFDPQNAHRFTVFLFIKQGGHDDKVKWTIEPKD